jgi:hypothetical protein
MEWLWSLVSLIVSGYQEFCYSVNTARLITNNVFFHNATFGKILFTTEMQSFELYITKQPAKVRQSCSATDYYYYIKN